MRSNWVIDIVKYSFSRVVLQQGIEKLPATKPENGHSKLQYSNICQRVYDDLPSVKLLAANNTQAFFSPNICYDLIFISRILCIRLFKFFIHCQKRHKLQLLSELHTVHTAGTDICTWIRSPSQLLMWRSRPLNSDNYNVPSTKLRGNRLPNT